LPEGCINLFERFTEKAIKVLTDAQNGAKELNHSKLCPEHILLGIVNQKSGIASKFLKAAGLNSQNIKEKLKLKLKNIETTNATEILPFSNSLKLVLKKTWDKSIELKTHYILPEHIFLSLIAKETSGTSKILEEMEIDVSRIKISVERIVEKKVSSTVHPEARRKKYSAETPSSFALNFDNILPANMLNVALEKLKNTNFEAIGTEQIMLAIFENAEDNLFEIFKNEGITKDIFLQKLSETTSRAEEYNKEILYTPKAYLALNSASEIAKELGSSVVLPEHIVLGLLREKAGIAYNIFKKTGIDPNRIYEQIIKPIEKQKPVAMTIIRLAKEEARRLGHNTVGSELILLGIIGEGVSIASEALSELGVNIKDARKAVEELIGLGDYCEGKEITLSPRAKKIMEFACEEAKKVNKKHIESEYLLFGIISEKGCLANKVLENLGVDAIEVKQGILKKLK
jgi:ATP-dependent Clp protease ATP-binding subunit ClpA